MIKKVLYRILFLSLLSIQSVCITVGQGLEEIEAKLMITLINSTEWRNGIDEVSMGILGNSRMLTVMSSHLRENKLPHRVDRVNFLEEVINYDLIFVPRASFDDVDKMVAMIGEHPILVIAEEYKIENKELDICLKEEDGKLRFTVNETNAKKKGFVFSDRLLDYASEIH